MEGNQVAVLGAGHGGYAAAADLTMRGFGVRLFNRTPHRLQPIRDAGGIHLEGVAGEGFVPISIVTTDLHEAVEGADIIVLAVPTSAFTYYAPALATLVKPDQVIMLNPGHMGGSLYFANELRRQSGQTGFRVCETTTLTYACRMQGPATVKIYNVATNLLFAAFPAKYLDETYDRVVRLFPNIVKAANVLETGLLDLNAVEHPAQILCNAGWVEHTKGDYYFYYEGTTPAVARVIEAVDAERMKLAKAAGVPTRSFVQYFHQAGYTSERAARIGRVYEAMQDSEPNRWLKAPSSLDHRYVHEDVGWGLVPWSGLAGILDVTMPTVDSLITLASIMNDVDYRREGLTLERMGLGGLGKEDLALYVREGGD